MADGREVDSIEGYIVPPEGKAEAVYRMGIKSIRSVMRIYDPEDESKSDLILRGVNVGQYRNKIMTAHSIASEGNIGDYEKYICYRASKEFEVPVSSPEEVIKANELCMDKYGWNLAEWSEAWMETEIDWSALEE